MTVGMTNKQALSCARVLAKRMGLVLLEQNMTLHSVHYNFDHGVVEHHLSYI